MTSQSLGPAEFDGAHDPQLRTAEGAAMVLSEGRTVAAEDVCQLQFRRHRWLVSDGGQRQVETVERTWNSTDRAGGDVEVAGRGRQAAVTEQQLDGA